MKTCLPSRLKSIGAILLLGASFAVATAQQKDPQKDPPKDPQKDSPKPNVFYPPPSIEYWEGDGLDNIFNTNAGYVGVGQMAPEYQLDVLSPADIIARFGSYAAAHTQVLITAPTGYNANLTLQNGGVSKWLLGNRAANDRFGFTNATSTTEVFSILQTGAVGIGTVAPAYRLDVQGGQINASGGLCIAGICKSSWSEVGGGSQWTGGIGATLSYIMGNVGVGTSSPTAQLHVVGANGPLTNTAAAAPDALRVVGGTGGNGTWGASAGGLGGAISLAGGTGGTPVAGSQAALGGKGGSIDLVGGNGGPNVFAVGGGAGGDISINGGAGVGNSDGNISLANLRGKVGIGSSTPGYRLDVQGGQINSSGGLCIAGVCRSNWSEVGQWSNSGANIFFNTGNVGIGITNPSTKLQVAGGTRVDGTSGRIYLGTTAVENYRGLEIIEENPTTFSIRHHDPNVAWRNIAINPYGGNVGIGTATPGYRLDVQGGQLNASGGLCIAGICKSAWSEVGGSQWTTGASNALYYNSGNVGIGSTSPVFDANAGRFLTVDGGAGAIGSLGVGSGTNSNATTLGQMAFVNSNLGTTEKRVASIVGATDTAMNSGVLDFYTTNAGTWGIPKMRVTSGGNVGIGTASPAVKLDVGGQIHVAGICGSTVPNSQGGYISWNQLGCGVGETDFINHQGGGTGGFWFANTSNAGASLTSLMLIKGDGKVGIGTNNPGEKLEVAGNLKLTGTGNIDASGTITGGNIVAKYQDVAEWVQSSQQLAAGTVVVLDHTKSNQVIASSQAYDTRVAGVISLQPGITLGENGAGKVLVATTGRVKVRVDASAGPIQVGDLLVTSDKEGIAKKSEPLNLGGVQIHRPGTLVGKALEPLASGTGEILVLLSLQ